MLSSCIDFSFGIFDRQHKIVAACHVKLGLGDRIGSAGIAQFFGRNASWMRHCGEMLTVSNSFVWTPCLYTATHIQTPASQPHIWVSVVSNLNSTCTSYSWLQNNEDCPRPGSVSLVGQWMERGFKDWNRTGVLVSLWVLVVDHQLCNQTWLWPYLSGCSTTPSIMSIYHTHAHEPLVACNLWAYLTCDQI